MHLTEWWYNSTYHTSAKVTPFQDLYEYKPPKWKDLATVQTNLPDVTNQLEETQKFVQTLKENLNNARNCMKQQANQNKTKREFEVGEWVFVKLQPYK